MGNLQFWFRQCYIYDLAKWNEGIVKSPGSDLQIESADEYRRLLLCCLCHLLNCKKMLSKVRQSDRVSSAVRL